MAVITIDSFSYISLGVTTSINVYFDDESEVISYEILEGSLLNDPLNQAERGRTDASLITIYNNAFFQWRFFTDLGSPFAATPGPEPLDVVPDACDLIVNAGTANETAQGANDGQATIAAVSIFSGIQVSINNVDFYSTPHTFTGLTPGNYIGYAKDDNGCTSQVLFYIEAFSNPIEGGFAGGLPEVTVSEGNISRWNAAFNPVVLNFETILDPAKKNFRVEIEITSQASVVTGTWSPGPNGKTRADISAYLKSLVNAKDDFKYDVLNWRDYNRAASFTIRYREVWDAGSSVWYYAPYPLYVTFSAKQLGDQYGGNMAKYVPFFSEPNPILKAGFLTLFPQPTAWVGLPFDTSFIFSEYLITKEVKLRTTSLDINMQPIGAPLNSFLLNNDSGYILGSDTDKLIIQPGQLPPVSNDGIFEELGINRLMLAGDPALLVEYFKIQLYTGTDEDPNFVTQPLTIKIEKLCSGPYIYLKWLNALGGWDYWRFSYNNIRSLTTSNQLTIDRNVFDWESDDTIEDDIKKNAVEKITIGVTVPTDKLPGLKGLHTSIKVMRLTSTNPTRWQTVTLNVGSFDIGAARNRFAELKFTINLPAINIQENGSMPLI